MKAILLKILIVAILINNYSFAFAGNVSTASALDAIYDDLSEEQSSESEEEIEIVATESEINNLDESVQIEIVPEATASETAEQIIEENVLLGETGYTVKWINYDGTELEVDNNVAANAFPYYDGKIPVKEENDGINYTFAGWQPEISNVVADIDYIALFEETDRKVEDGMEIGKFSFDESLLNIAIMTDPHVPYESRYSAFGSTNADLLKNRIENALDSHGANAILVAGDFTAESRSEEYDLYNNIISSYNDRCDFVTAAGNHEFRFTIGGAWNRRSQFNSIYAPRWRTKMQTGLYFSKWLGDTHVVAIGDNYYDTDIRDSNGNKNGYDRSKAWMTSAELNWFEKIVEEDDERGITTIVLCHWPIIDTENGSSHGSSYWAVRGAENRLKSIISSHDNVILFSGHTHSQISGTLPSSVESGGMCVHAGSLTSTVPTYVSMKQVETDKFTKKYELKYILPTRESQVFTFSHDVPSYTITFKNDDGTELQNMQCVYGEMPVYIGENPISTIDSTKLFIGWTEGLTSVTESREYIARYTDKPNSNTSTNKKSQSGSRGGNSVNYDLNIERQFIQQAQKNNQLSNQSIFGTRAVMQKVALKNLIVKNDGNKTICLKDNSEKIYGIQKIEVDGKDEIYFFQDDSSLYCGWMKDENNNYRYFAADGKMVIDKYLAIGEHFYKFDEKGELDQKDLSMEEKQYILSQSGVQLQSVEVVKDSATGAYVAYVVNPITGLKEPARGLVKIVQDDGINTYCFNEKGEMLLGMQLVGQTFMYFDPKNGHLVYAN